MHCRFVLGPLGEFGRVDAPLAVFLRPVVEGQEAVIALRAVEKGVAGTVALV
ncbi:MAG: hypothetical protein MZV64_59480 [Ignavibacteriales bacterium]|nr:hypothetical protein [Ignavibacteriales bacterium]